MAIFPPRLPKVSWNTRLVALADRLPEPLAGWFRLFSSQGAIAGYLATTDQALISLANFFATLILARAASPTELGVYGVGFIALRLVRAVQEGLTIQPLNTFGAGMEEAEFRRYATQTSLLQIGLGVISAAGVALAGWLLTGLGNDVAGPALFALWSAFLWWQFQEYLRRMLYTRSQVFLATFNTGIASAVRLGLMLLWARQGCLDGTASLNAIALGSLAALLPGLWQTRRYWTAQFSGLRQAWQRNWEFGRWVLGGALANWLSIEFYPVLTAGMISFAAAGAYRALQNIVAPIHLLLRAMDTFMTPRLARLHQQAGLRAVNRRLGLVYLLLGLPIGAILGAALLFPRPLLHLLYGETYLEYSPAMAWMAVFYTLLYTNGPVQTALKASRFSRPIFVGNLVAIGVMLTGGLWLIRQWGVYGTIAGQAINELVVVLVCWSAWMRLQKSTCPPNV